jgi:divalent metal cation (Fe/Co/Zn/Cd) transporter
MAGRVKRTPKTLYKVPDEETPLLGSESSPSAYCIEAPNDDTVDTSSPVVSVAISINFAANALLLMGKIAVIVLTSSLSVLASLVDAALDFLSTVIVFTTTKMIGQRDQYHYPIGRSRLEPLGVLVFSVIMITCFTQVALQCIQSLMNSNHFIVQLGIPSVAIMVGTVLIKGMCWFWCRLINNSSVQALAQDAMTDGKPLHDL